MNENRGLNQERCLGLACWIWIIASVLFGRTTLEGLSFLSSTLLYKLGRYAVYVLLIAIILRYARPNTQKRFWIMFVVALALGISLLCSKEVVLVSVLLFVCASVNARPSRIMKAYFVAHLLVLVITVFLSTIRVIDPNVMHRGETVRRTFGFIHPNAVGSELCVLTNCYLVLRGKKLSRWEILGGYLLSLVVFLLTDCRMAFIVTVFVLSGALVVKSAKADIVKRYLPVITYVILGGTIIASLFFSFVDNNKFVLLNKLDVVFSYRFDYMYASFQELGVSLFGKPATANTLLDNSFARVFFINGLIPYLLFVGTCLQVTRIFVWRRNSLLLIVWCGILLSGFLENSLFRMEYNWAFLVAGSMLPRQKQRSDENLRQWAKRMLTGIWAKE